MLKKPFASLVAVPRPLGAAAVTVMPASGFFVDESVSVPEIEPVVRAKAGPASTIATRNAASAAPMSRLSRVRT